MKYETANLFMRILETCKAEVCLTYNPHRSNYESVESFMTDHDRKEDVEPEVLEGMIANDRIFQLQMYLDTPVGSYLVYHYDIDLLMVDAANTIGII